MADPITIGAVVGWGLSAGGWVASPIISRLVNRVFCYIDFDTSKNLKELDMQVLKLERVMQAVDISPYRDRLEPLFNELKSAFYEAEDILDDIEYHRLKKQIQEEKLKPVPPHLRMNWVKKLQSALPSSPLKHEASGTSKIELKKRLETIEKVIKKACEIVKDLNLPSDYNDGRAIAANSRSSATTSLPPQQVIGRDQDRDKIIAMLHEQEDDDQQNTNTRGRYTVIGIHGIAGSGKSTLAQFVFAHEIQDKEDDKVDHFDLIMWVHVSQKFDLDGIYKEMLEGATGESCPEFSSRDALQRKLMKELRGKRILLALDDVWSPKDGNLEKLKQILSPLNVEKARSKVLVTSRTEGALLALGAAKQRCIPLSDLDDEVFLKMFMHYALQEDAQVDAQDRRELEMIGEDIAKKLKRSPLAARTVGAQLCGRPDVKFWRRAKDRDLMNETMGALWWSYQHLDAQLRRCFAYCSIFPRRHRLVRDDLIKLWVAEGFIKTTDPEVETEDVGQDYFDELVSASFLQLGGNMKVLGGGDEPVDCFTIHDLLLDLAEDVAGRDCFRIENGWTGEVREDVRYLLVSTYDREMLTDKIFKLQNLRTLIIDNTIRDIPIEEVFGSMFKRLRKLRVLSVKTNPAIFSLPPSIGQLKHLRYFAFRVPAKTELILPGTITELYHMQTLNFGDCVYLVFSSGEDMMNLINLRGVISKADLKFPDIGRMTWLQVLPFFTVMKKQGYEIHQLKDLNRLQGKLQIHGLENVQTKEDALEANLAGKEQLAKLVLVWDVTCCSPEVQAEVLEALCPSKYLKLLEIRSYHGLTYPNWMIRNGGPKNLQELVLNGCVRLGPSPELFEFFIHLRSLRLRGCSWDALPGNMENLTSLKELEIGRCLNICSLPTLPQSLEVFKLRNCNKVFMRSCKTINDPNWKKIEHIPEKEFTFLIDGRVVPFC